jgi:hypothetical protein
MKPNMTKIKITIEIDVDFQKFFDDIPEGLYKEKEDVDESHELDVKRWYERTLSIC